MKTETENLRELDAFCIEHVMGFTKALKMSQIERSGQFIIQGEEIYIHDRGNYVKTFNPTTDPAAAMLVLEKCIEKKGAPAFDKDKAGNFEIASIDKDCQAVFMVRAYTLPLAICKFAKELFK